ncbi:hypothetical protein Ddye_029913 [Dipteronia dyeriana]|uniref:Transposase MuDR plant domain-containing protein n=1 Tax=Dipteronia dyeriana TaxID=168575 RepID=A0AAD9TG21_9ROSI|nr:hypothetical protein Ddye_029913 [Dipteronia dyeriana]
MVGVRKDDDGQPKYDPHDPDQFFSFRVHHGGEFNGDMDEYIGGGGGAVSFYDYVSLDELSLLDLDDIAMELGYKLPVGYWVQVDGYGKPYNISSDQQLMWGNWAENHMHATIDGPSDVKLHGSPASSDNVVGKVHARVSEEAGEGEGEYEAEGGDDADFVIDPDYEQEADDIATETCVDPTKIWDRLNVPNRPHEELGASGSEFEDVSDELCSLEGSDVRVQKFMHRTYHEFHPERDMQDPNFKVGMLFGTTDIFRKAIRAHAVKHKRDVKFQKNDKHRVRAVYKSEACNWFVYASWLSDHKTFQIKTLCNEHTCAMSFKNKFVNSRLIAEK